MRPRSGLRGSNQIGATSRSRKLGSLPRLCWPLLRIKRQALSLRRRQSWTGRPARYRDGLARLQNRNDIGLLPFRAPSRVSKRIKFRSPHVFRDAQRRADKLGRHARAVYLDLCRRFAKRLFTKLPAKMARISASAQRRYRTGLGFQPLSLGPWWTKSRRG